MAHLLTGLASSLPFRWPRCRRACISATIVINMLLLILVGIALLLLRARRLRGKLDRGAVIGFSALRLIDIDNQINVERQSSLMSQLATPYADATAAGSLIVITIIQHQRILREKKYK